MIIYMYISELLYTARSLVMVRNQRKWLNLKRSLNFLRRWWGGGGGRGKNRTFPFNISLPRRRSIFILC